MRFRLSRWSAAFFCAWLAWAAGCSDERKFKKVYPARGKITHKGQAVGRAMVNFAPVNGGADAVFATAETAPDGTFQLSTYKKADGAPAGEYIVTVYWPDNRPTAKKSRAPAGEELAPDRLGGAYADPGKSKLRATVREGDNDIPLDLP